VGPQRIERWIFPTEVDAGGLRREGDIRAIVDEDRDRQGGHEGSGHLQHVGR